MSTLYHYCSVAAFHAIVESRSLWLSSLSQSNDNMEGKLVSRTISALAKRDNLDLTATGRLQDTVESLETTMDGLGFCLSEKGDLLSQWRGYADDASGVSIGFSRTYLDWLSQESLKASDGGFTVAKVEYDPAAHEALVEPTYREVRKAVDAGALKPPQPYLGGLLNTVVRSEEEKRSEEEAIRKAEASALSAIINLYPKLFLLKSSAFQEENEWRLIAHTVREGANNNSYRIQRNRIVPYRAFEFSEMGRQPISEIFLGPKHQTPPIVVADFLKQRGFGEVTVTPSSASYR